MWRRTASKMPFDLPETPKKPVMPLPDTLRVVRDRSVQAFREKLGIFATDNAVGEYKEEIDRLMRVAYEKGRIDGR